MKALNLVLFVSSLSLCACATLPSAAVTDPLARGLDGDIAMSGAARWELADGQLTSISGEAPGFAYTKARYANYDMTMDFYPVGSTNSGVFFHCNDPAQITAATCYEANIWDSNTNADRRTGSLVGYAPPIVHVATEDKWNTMRLLVVGDHLQVWVNGVKTADLIDSTYSEGHIALQYGGQLGEVRFRNIRIRELD